MRGCECSSNYSLRSWPTITVPLRTNTTPCSSPLPLTLPQQDADTLASSTARERQGACSHTLFCKTKKKKKPKQNRSFESISEWHNLCAAAHRPRVFLVARSLRRAADRGTCIYLNRGSLTGEDRILFFPGSPEPITAPSRCSVHVSSDGLGHASPLKTALMTSLRHRQEGMGFIYIGSEGDCAYLLFILPAA